MRTRASALSVCRMEGTEEQGHCAAGGITSYCVGAALGHVLSLALALSSADDTRYEYEA
jgi:hypothetical protein